MKKLHLAVIFFLLCMSPMISLYALQSNPFDEPSKLPLQAPPFDKIKDSDFKPAFENGMKEQLNEIAAITNNPAAPTFENTVVALERSGSMLYRVIKVFSVMSQTNTNDVLDKIETEESPKLAAHQDAILLNSKLFMRVKSIYEKRDTLNLDAESLRLLKIYYAKFVHAGANLSQESKEKLAVLNQQIASLQTAFQQKLIAGTKASELVIANKAELAGLSNEEIADLAVRDGGKEKYIIPLQNTTIQPLLSVLSNRETREALFKHSWNRSELGDENDTRDIIVNLAKLRAEKASLLGYANYADLIVYNNMASNSTAISQFLGGLVPATTAKVTAENKSLQGFIDKGTHFDLKPWDWVYYDEQIRKSELGLDQQAVKPYFELNHVLINGAFYSATKLYGVTFKERFDLPLFNPDVRVFDVFDKDGSQRGIVYFDFFRRDNKAGGAWTDDFVAQSKLLGTKSVVYNSTNFNKPATGQPALLTFDEVVTIFHEFGHALHSLLMDVTYPTFVSDIAPDFVELPSKFNEHWAFYPDVLKNYAVHYKTGQSMPQIMIDKIKNMASFNQGQSVAELLAAAALDLEWHRLFFNAAKQDVNIFETQALANTQTAFTNVLPRYRTSYFRHIWLGDYAGSYYSYLWTEMLAADAFLLMKQHGGLTRENGQRFRDLILSQGSAQEYHAMFQSFYGKEPDIEPMLENRGL